MDPSQNPPPLVTLDDIRAAARRLQGITVRTPLLPFGGQAEGGHSARSRAWLKPEQLQPIGAYKLRGAYNAMAQLSHAERRAGVVTASSGNHAQGVARAGRLLGIHATVVMPSDAPRMKRQRVLADGAAVIVVGTGSEERNARALEIAEAEGKVHIPSYDDTRIVAGQGTVGLEIADDLPLAAGSASPGTPFTVLVPVGGGGLSAGVATAVKTLHPEASVFGVEPELAADAQQSLAQGHVVRWSSELTARTIADGVRTTSLGLVPFLQLRAYLDGIITVTEDEICRAMVRTRDHACLIVEPAGALSLAAWLFHASELPGDGQVIAVQSGGNVDPGTYATLIARGERAGG